MPKTPPNKSPNALTTVSVIHDPGGPRNVCHHPDPAGTFMMSQRGNRGPGVGNQHARGNPQGALISPQQPSLQGPIA